MCRGCQFWRNVTPAHHVRINLDNSHCAVLAREFAKSGRVGLALVVGTTLLVGMVENVEVVVISVATAKILAMGWRTETFSTPVSPT